MQRLRNSGRSTSLQGLGGGELPIRPSLPSPPRLFAEPLLAQRENSLARLSLSWIRLMDARMEAMALFASRSSRPNTATSKRFWRAFLLVLQPADAAAAAAVLILHSLAHSPLMLWCMLAFSSSSSKKKKKKASIAWQCTSLGTCPKAITLLAACGTHWDHAADASLRERSGS